MLNLLHKVLPLEETPGPDSKPNLNLLREASWKFEWIEAGVQWLSSSNYRVKQRSEENNATVHDQNSNSEPSQLRDGLATFCTCWPRKSVCAKNVTDEEWCQRQQDIAESRSGIGKASAIGSLAQLESSRQASHQERRNRKVTTVAPEFSPKVLEFSCVA